MGCNWCLKIFGLVLLLTAECLSQCFMENSCTGGVIPEVSNKRDCCVKTNEGLAFFSRQSCSVCIGKCILNLFMHI